MSELGDRTVEEFLAAAYPDERQRGHAERWLGLLACRADADGEIRWWEIPAIAPARAVIWVRRLVLWPPVVAVIVLGTVVGAKQHSAGAVWYVVIVGLPFAMAVSAFKKRRRRGRVALRIRPAGPYRTERRSCLLRGLAWAPVGGLLGALAAWGTDLAPEVIAAHAVVAAACGGLLPSPYLLLKLSERVLSAAWQDRIRFMPLLEGAADRGLLREVPAGYQFRDDALLDCLAASGRAALAGRVELQARRLAGRGVRAWLVRHLTKRRVTRIGVDAGWGAGIMAGVGLGLVIPSAVVANVRWVAFPGGALFGAVAWAGAYTAAYWLLGSVSRASATTLTYLPLVSRRSRVAAATSAVACAVALVALA